MTFTYVGDLSTSLDKVRFYIGDTDDSSGSKPDSSAFTDEELGGLITAEGTWQKAVAASFEVLAGLYSSYVDITEGPRSEKMGQTAERYAALAKEWRAKFGTSTGGSTGAGTRHPTRIDGYSSDVASDEE